MSLINKFNQPDETPLHSSGMAGSSATPRPQSFTERMQLDRQRRVIKGYRFSMQGSSMREPGVLSKPAARTVAESTTASTMSRRQAYNAGDQPLPPPPASKYNPYA